MVVFSVFSPVILIVFVVLAVNFLSVEYCSWYPLQEVTFFQTAVIFPVEVLSFVSEVLAGGVTFFYVTVTGVLTTVFPDFLL